jgi:hypothetical protein
MMLVRGLAMKISGAVVRYRSRAVLQGWGETQLYLEMK